MREPFGLSIATIDRLGALELGQGQSLAQVVGQHRGHPTSLALRRQGKLRRERTELRLALLDFLLCFLVPSNLGAQGLVDFKQFRGPCRHAAFQLLSRPSAS